MDYFLERRKTSCIADARPVLFSYNTFFSVTKILVTVVTRFPGTVAMKHKKTPLPHGFYFEFRNTNTLSFTHLKSVSILDLIQHNMSG